MAGQPGIRGRRVRQLAVETGSSPFNRTSFRGADCDPKEIAAIELALRFKGNLAVLGSLDKIQLTQGPSVGAVWTACEMARRLGIDQALGNGFAPQLALWQVLARVLEQGSQRPAVRLAQTHAACDVLGLRRGFDENDLYANLTWLSEHQEAIEKRLFAARRGQRKPELFLYDVTGSYLEGEDNAYGDYGYPRDGKKGKKQIVIGLLCDEEGEAHAVFDTGEGAGLRQLPAHSHAGPGRRRLTQGAGDSPARSTTPHGHPRGHAQATPRAP